MNIEHFKYIFHILRNKWIQIGMGLLFSVLLTIVTIQNIYWHEISEKLTGLPTHTLILLLIPVALIMVLRAMRWYLLLPGEHIKFIDVLLVQNTGIGLNNISPVRMISEPIQLGLITRKYRVGFSKAFTGLVCGNFLDVLASAIVITLGLLFIPPLRDQAISIPIVGAIILFCVSTLVFVAIGIGINKMPLIGRLQYFQEIVDSASLLKTQPLNLFFAFWATLCHWIAIGFIGWILMLSFGLEGSLISITVILVSATFFTSAVPSAPAGTGTFHFAITTMLVSLGADQPSAFSFSIVMHLYSVLPSSAIAIIMVWRLGAKSILERK